MRCLLTACFFCVSVSLCLAQDSKSTAKPAKDSKEATDKMISSGAITGRLLNWEDGKKEKSKIKLEVTVLVADPAGMQNLERLQLQLRQVAANPGLNLVDRARQTADINRQIAQINATREKKEKIEVQVADNIIVRRAELP